MRNVKRALSNFKPYQPNQETYTVKLDANESKQFLRYDDLRLDELSMNLYPDTSSTLLRQAIGKFLNMNPKRIIAGNGSSEMIELILKTYVDKDDIVLSFEPSFSMYKIYTTIHNGTYIPISSNHDFSCDIDMMIQKAFELKPTLIFICSPNNPTGQLIKQKDIISLVESTDALVCLDEAYIEFTDEQKSLVDLVDAYDNFIVIRTMSKAYGLAGIRLGYLVSNEQIVSSLNSVKSPYNLNQLTQHVGVYALSKVEEMIAYTRQIIKERARVEDALKRLNIILYPSQANFVFFYSYEKELYRKLLDKGILVRAFDGELTSYYRVTIGEPFENQAFIDALKEILS